VLLIDYRDSFVHNLASYLRELGSEVVTLRTGFPVELIDEIKPELVLLSPGPGTPTSFGIKSTIDQLLKRDLPIFGVCLGHQGIGEYFGAKLGVLPTPVHGKWSNVKHNGDGLFADIPETFEVGRYHSLFLEEHSIPTELEVTAITGTDGSVEDPFPVIMGIRHKQLPVAGVQFHPESLMTLKQHIGHQLLHNVLMELVK
jgi:anthranilate synthase